MPPARAPAIGGLTAAITKCICCLVVGLQCSYTSYIVYNQQKISDLDASSMTGALSSTNYSRVRPKTEVIDGQRIVWEGVASPKGVLLVFHGCGHSATDWWDRQESCPDCKGLPEEKRIVATAVARSYAVVAFSSQDRTFRSCWDVVAPPRITVDIQKTKNSVKELATREAWDKLPMFALGASSGGALVALLPFHLKLQGVCLQIMAVPSEVYKGLATANVHPFPPMLFVHMVRDGVTAAGIAKNVAALTQEGVATKTIGVTPRPLATSFFSERIEGITTATSQRLFLALQEAGLVAADGLLRENPRQRGDLWRDAFKLRVEEKDLKLDLEAISEELNLAWAGHELISDTTNEMLDWFESWFETKST